MSQTYAPTRTPKLEGLRSTHMEMFRLGSVFYEGWDINYTEYAPIRVHPTIDQPTYAQYPSTPTFTFRTPTTAIYTCEAVDWNSCSPGATVFPQGAEYIAYGGLPTGYACTGWFQHESAGSEQLGPFMVGASSICGSWPRGLAIGDSGHAGYTLFWTGPELSAGAPGEWSGYLYQPEQRIDTQLDTPYPNIAVWLNTIRVRRSRLRMTAAKTGWIGSVDIYACKSTSGFPTGWDDYAHAGTNYQLCFPSPVTNLGTVNILPFGGTAFTDTDRMSYINEVPFPSTTSMGTLAAGFVGRINFMVWNETPSAWSARTGLTVV